jgi:HSP20 family protein
MLMRTDPFRDLDRLSQQLLGLTGTTSRPSVMAMDAWRDGEQFYAEFDLPGIDPRSIDLEVERNVLTIKAERPTLDEQSDRELLAAERPRGVFTRQLILGDNLDTEHVQAQYDYGVLRLKIPVAEQAKSRKVMIDTSSNNEPQAINA